MATGFDFEDFYVNETARTEAAIDRSGVTVQNPTETAEYTTNNVVYYVHSLVAITFDNETVECPQGTTRIAVLETGSATGGHYVRAWHPLGEVAGLGVSPTWNPRVDRESVFLAEPTVGYTYLLLVESGETTVSTAIRAFSARVYPRYETEANVLATEESLMPGGYPARPVSQGVITDPKVMKLLYGALGMYGDRWKGLKWLKKVWDRGSGLGDSAVLPYDRFRKRLDYLADICRESDVGFTVTYYDQSFAGEVDAEDATADDYRNDPAKAREKHRAYLEAEEAADITRTGMPGNASFAEAYGRYLPEFVATTGFMAPPAAPTALIPPAKTAVKAFFYPPEELEADFSSLFKGVMDAMSRVPVLWRFVSRSTRRALDGVKSRYTVQSMYSTRMAFDVEYYLASMVSAPRTGYYVPRLVQVGGMADGTTMITKMDPPTKELVTYQAGAEYEGDPVYGYAGLADPDTNRKNKNYCSVDAATLAAQFAAMYNTGVKIGSNPGGTVIDAEEFAARVAAGDSIPELYVDNWNLVVVYERFCTFLNYFRYKLGGLVDDTPETGMRMDTLLDLVPAAGITWAEFEAAVSAETGHVFTTLVGNYDVMCWDSAVVPGEDDYSGMKAPVAAYPDVWHDISDLPFETCGMALDAIDLMGDAYGQMRTAATVEVALIGAAAASRGLMALSDISGDLDELSSVCAKLRWYQRLVEESPFTNLSLVPASGSPTCLSSFPARMAFPVSMYRKVKVRRRDMFGRMRTRTVRRSIGVRWAEVTFYDASVYREYPQVEEEPGETLDYRSAYTVSDEGGSPVLELEERLPDSAVEAGRGSMVFASGDRVAYTVEGDYRVTVPGGMPESPGDAAYLKVPLTPSQPDGAKEKVVIRYSVPGLPYDSEIRKKAFADYGPLSQSRFFETVRNGGIDPDREDGWRVFRPSSALLADLRDGMGLHDKVAMLLSVLREEFGSSRVSLADTWRSMDDQAGMCSGGPESAFLSWHNYGLAATVMITRADGKTPMEKGDPDMARLVEVARAFTECCEQGRFGTPCNVVWCARLAVGQSLFDWEFLPVGVGHKEAPAFRDALMAQTDPVHELGYVDVDAAGYVLRDVPGDGRPYVLESSPALARAEVRGGHRYLSPAYIRNFPHVDGIALYDVKEFCDLVRLKMSANGTSRPESGSMYDWMALNPVSCAQLVQYYAMTGNVASARALLAGEFVERYLPVEEQFFNTSPVDYVKGMLGRHYAGARICTERDGDSSYITLSDGILHVRQLDAYPDSRPTRFDMHKQQRVDGEHVRRGVWKDGLFYTEDELDGGIPYVESEGPVIDGYEGGEAVSGEAVLLHQVVATQIHRRFEEIRKAFEGFDGALMYDRAADGPNTGMGDMLENEFGIIAAQDLLSFDELAMVAGGAPGIAGTSGDGDGGRSERDRVMVDGSIYEKVVNNAQLAGIRKASLDREHLHVKDMPTPSDGKTLYELLAKGRGYSANDLI